ncbi:MAG: transketolase C-terminal domain-containing protein, partial [Planctomycetota bacterium]|jgi:transketolase
LYAGLFVGKNGASHQALEDIAIMRSIANMAVVQPADALETEQVVRFAAGYDGPMYVRVGRDPRPQMVPSNYRFQLGKACTLRDGKDVTLITCGDVVENTLEAAASLAEKKIEARVINMSSIQYPRRSGLGRLRSRCGKNAG